MATRRIQARGWIYASQFSYIDGSSICPGEDYTFSGKDCKKDCFECMCFKRYVGWLNSLIANEEEEEEE